MVDIRNVAYHEAGHVVADFHLGLITHFATIKAEGDLLGSVQSPGQNGYVYRTKTDRKTAVRDMIVSVYAGPEAERIFDPGCNPLSWMQDEIDAFAMLGEIPPRGCTYVGDDAYFAKLERLRRDARRLVHTHWADVVTIANALLERETLTGRDIEGLIQRVDTITASGVLYGK